jgi:LppX_LprAFG lipoprotein
MTRRPSTLLAFAAGMLIVLAACGGGASTPELTDPTAIVTAALKSTEGAKSVHLEAVVDGTAPISVPGLGGEGAPIDLSGTSASADVDLANTAAHATFHVPALLNLTGDLIAVDGKAYLKTTLTGPQYEVMDLANQAVDPSDTGGMIDGLGDFLLSGDVTLAKGDDVPCGSATCYTVTSALTADELTALLGGAAAGLPVDLDGASLAVAVKVEKEAPNHLAGVTVTITPATGTPLSVDLTLSGWDAPVSISAPPADQVKGG